MRWEEANPESHTGIRRSILKVGDYDLKTILSRRGGIGHGCGVVTGWGGHACRSWHEAEP